MSVSPVPLAGARELITPAATMRTYASPSGPGQASIAVWRTTMEPGTAGPLHAVSEDQVLVVLEGGLDALVDGAEHALGPNDALVLPAGVQRRLTAGSEGAVTLWASRPGATARVGDGDPVPVPWAR
ncbi:MAG TPA: cupin domain-containing protein [Marmoricola sp.]|nr:cupin domain-containing protein [Marmoricola sp.]